MLVRIGKIEYDVNLSGQLVKIMQLDMYQMHIYNI